MRSRDDTIHLRRGHVRRFLSWTTAMALLTMATPVLLLAQRGREITGKVTDSSSMSIIEALISVLGDQQGVRTNERGEYRLRVPAGEVTILARAIGYTRRPAQIAAGQTTQNFVLAKDVLQLEGVTVTGEATTISKQNAATAVTSVSAENVVEVPAGSIESNLAGKLTGVLINQNGGNPGGGAQIQIRGQSTILGQADPLYVVDGIIVSDAA